MKHVILFVVSAIILISIVVFFFLPGRHPVNAINEPVPQNKAVTDAKPKASRAAPLAKVTVITPVNVADEPFSAYELHQATGKERDEDREKGAAQTTEKRDIETRFEELSIKAAKEEKTSRENIQSDKGAAPIQDKKGNQDELARNRPSAPDRRGPLDKEVVQDSKTDAETEAVKQLDERAIEAGISEAGRKKLIQSYKDLRKVLPEKEAQKMIMWKIVHENHK